MNKKLIALNVIGMFILLLSMVPINAEINHEQNKELNFSITSNFADECILTNLDKPSGINELFINGTKNSRTFSFSMNESNFEQSGEYKAYIECSDEENSVTDCKTINVEPTGIFSFDLESNFSIIIFVILSILAGILFYLGFPLFSAIILIIQGFIMISLEFNIIISTIFILAGVLVGFLKGGES
ncbi:MAG: hypothetical protein ACOC56_02025 [Atribacterota bacterium]